MHYKLRDNIMDSYHVNEHDCIYQSFAHMTLVRSYFSERERDLSF